MKKLLYILILSIVSCASFSQDTLKIKGKYILDSKDSFGELELLENHKFNYRYVAGLIHTKSEGTWEIKDDHIILTSNSRYEHNKIEVKELNNVAESEISMRFEDNNPVIMAGLIINNDSTKVYTTDEKGKIKLPEETNILNFSVFYLGESYDYKVNKGKSFLIELFPDDLNKTYFNKRKYKLRKNKLVDIEYNWKYYKTKE